MGRKILLIDAYEVRKSLKWFEIMGKDGTWREALNKVIVWNNEDSNPQQVRCAWSAYPEGANLYNRQVYQRQSSQQKNTKN